MILWMHPKIPLIWRTPLAGACAEYIVLIQKQESDKIKKHIYIYIYIYISVL